MITLIYVVDLYKIGVELNFVYWLTGDKFCTFSFVIMYSILVQFPITYHFPAIVHHIVRII
jgi:hypothetical protein